MWDTRLRSSRLSKGVIGSTLLPLSQFSWAHLQSTPHSKCSRVPRTLLSLAICMFLIFQSISSFPGRHGAFLPVSCLHAGIYFFFFLNLILLWSCTTWYTITPPPFALGLLTATVILNPYQHGVSVFSALPLELQASRKEGFFFLPNLYSLEEFLILGLTFIQIYWI